MSIWHWLIFLAIALILFGGSGKISSIMGDVAKGIKSFKKGMQDDDEVAKAPDAPKPIDGPVLKAGETTPQAAAGTAPGQKVG